MPLPKPSDLVKRLNEENTTHDTEYVQDDIQLSADQLKNFLNYHGLSDKEFSDLLGVSPQAVKLWKTGQREFSETNSKLLRLFDKHPKLMREF